MLHLRLHSWAGDNIADLYLVDSWEQELPDLEISCGKTRISGTASTIKGIFGVLFKRWEWLCELKWWQDTHEEIRH
jgi:hypothetical protein